MKKYKRNAIAMLLVGVSMTGISAFAKELPPVGYSDQDVTVTVTEGEESDVGITVLPGVDTGIECADTGDFDYDEFYDESKVTVTVTEGEESDAGITILPGVDTGIDDNEISTRSTIQVIDLGTNTKKTMNFSSIGVGGNKRSKYNYITDSEKLKVHLKAKSQKTAVRVALYRTGKHEVASKTMSIGTITGKTMTFNNLTQAYKYYVKVYNTDTHSQAFSGSIRS